MPTFDPTIATPPVGSGANVDQLAYQNRVAKQDVTGQEGLTLGEIQQTWSKETLPQLQSGIAAAGQYYGSANVQAQANAGRHMHDTINDVTTGAAHQLNDLTRQQTYAALGLII